MALINESTDLYCNFATLMPTGIGSALVGFKVETNVGGDPEAVAQFHVLQQPTGGNLDSMVAEAHEMMAQTFELMAKILRREAQPYRSRSE